MSDPSIFHERPKVVEARCFEGDPQALMGVVNWIIDSGYTWSDLFTPMPLKGVSIDVSTGFLLINTPVGVMHARRGDYIVKDAAGDVRPWPEAEFVARYQSASVVEQEETVKAAAAVETAKSVAEAVVAASIKQEALTEDFVTNVLPGVEILPILPVDVSLEELVLEEPTVEDEIVVEETAIKEETLVEEVLGSPIIEEGKTDAS